MAFFARRWFDRVLGGRTEAGVTARTLEGRQAEPEDTSVADVEEGATAARDEGPRHEPMQPPGVS